MLNAKGRDEFIESISQASAKSGESKRVKCLAASRRSDHVQAW
jgi:hypothetical protein